MTHEDFDRRLLSMPEYANLTIEQIHALRALQDEREMKQYQKDRDAKLENERNADNEYLMEHKLEQLGESSIYAENVLYLSNGKRGIYIPMNLIKRSLKHLY